jgi:hypothetical protein
VPAPDAKKDKWPSFLGMFTPAVKEEEPVQL